MTDPEEDLLTFAAMTACNLNETRRTQTPSALSARICDNTRQLGQTQHWLPTSGMRHTGIYTLSLSSLSNNDAQL